MRKGDQVCGDRRERERGRSVSHSVGGQKMDKEDEKGFAASRKERERKEGGREVDQRSTFVRSFLREERFKGIKDENAAISTSDGYDGRRRRRRRRRRVDSWNSEASLKPTLRSTSGGGGGSEWRVGVD